MRIKINYFICISLIHLLLINRLVGSIGGGGAYKKLQTILPRHKAPSLLALEKVCDYCLPVLTV